MVLSTGGNDRIISNNAEKTEVFNKYFCSAFRGKKPKPENVVISSDDTLSIALVSQEDIKQQPLRVQNPLFHQQKLVQ